MKAIKIVIILLSLMIISGCASNYPGGYTIMPADVIDVIGDAVGGVL